MADIRITRNRKYKRIIFDWTSTSGGGFTEAIGLNGKLIAFRHKADGGGTQPSDLYDVTLPITGGVADVLGGDGGNLSNTGNAQVVLTAPFYLVDDECTLTIANAGASKGGIFELILDME